MKKIIIAALAVAFTISANAKICQVGGKLGQKNDYSDTVIGNVEKYAESKTDVGSSLPQPDQFIVEEVLENIAMTGAAATRIGELSLDEARNVGRTFKQALSEAGNADDALEFVAVITMDPAGELVLTAVDVAGQMIGESIRLADRLQENAIMAAARLMNAAHVPFIGVVLDKTSNALTFMVSDYLGVITKNLIGNSIDVGCAVAATGSHLLRLDIVSALGSTKDAINETVQGTWQLLKDVYSPLAQKAYNGAKRTAKYAKVGYDASKKAAKVSYKYSKTKVKNGAARTKRVAKRISKWMKENTEPGPDFPEDEY